MLGNYPILLFAVLLFSMSALKAQMPVHRVSTLTAGYLLGGSGDGYFFELDHGFGFSVGHGAKWGRFTLLGGAGFEKFRRSNFLPLFISASSSLGKQESFSFGIRTGYAFAQSNGPIDAHEYRLRGGPLADMRFGIAMFRTVVGSLSTTLGYRYQRANLEFKPFDGGQKISSAQHYHFFSLNIGYTFFHRRNTPSPD